MSGELPIANLWRMASDLPELRASEQAVLTRKLMLVSDVIRNPTLPRVKIDMAVREGKMARSCEQANPIALAQWRLQSPKGQTFGWAKLDDEAVGLVVIDTTATSADTYIELYRGCPDRQEQIPWKSWDDGTGLEAVGSVPLEPGMEVWMKVGTYERREAVRVTLGTGFSIRGRVTDGETGLGLANYRVVATSSSLFSTLTDDAGYYDLAVSQFGPFFVNTQDFSGLYIDELYDDVVCEGFFGSADCDTNLGIRIDPQLDVPAEGIDFALQLGSLISGRVFDNLGQPVGGMVVRAASDVGLSRVVRSDLSGRFRIVALPAGNYALHTGGSMFRNLIYPDTPCPEGNCVVTSFPITLNTGEHKVGFDFGLDEFGRVDFEVRDELTDEVVPFARVKLLVSDGGIAAASGAALGEGSIWVATPGTYFFSTSPFGYLAEVWEDVDCEPDCDLQNATPLELQDNVRIDLAVALTPKAMFQGALATNDGGSLSGRNVSAINVDTDERFADLAGSDVDFQIELPPGRYVLVATLAGYYARLHSSESCPDASLESCDFTSAPPIAVGPGENTLVNFELERMAELRLQLTNRFGGSPPQTQARLTDGQGETREQFANGEVVSFVQLQPDAYKVSTIDGNAFAHAYPGIDCDYEGGPPCGAVEELIVLKRGELRVIGLNILPKRTIQGFVFDEAGTPLEGVIVDAWSADTGSGVGFSVSDSTGRYGLSPTSFDPLLFLSTSNDLGLLDVVYEDVPCPAGPAFENRCNPSQGEPVLLQADSPLREINMVLRPFDPVFTDGFEEAKPE